MTNEEYKKLKAKLEEEDLRREKIANIDEQINKWKNCLIKPNGWTARMSIKISQSCMVSYSADGNGNWKKENCEVVLDNRKDIDLFFDALEIVIDKKVKELQKLKEGIK